MCFLRYFKIQGVPQTTYTPEFDFPVFNHNLPQPKIFCKTRARLLVADKNLVIKDISDWPFAAFRSSLNAVYEGHKFGSGDGISYEEIYRKGQGLNRPKVSTPIQDRYIRI